MSADPSFASKITIGAALLGAAETSLTAPTTTSVIFTPDATLAQGGKVEEIVVQAASLSAVVASGLIYIFLYDGTTFSHYDTLSITGNTPSTTLAPPRVSKMYAQLFVPAGWTLRASQSVAANANLLKAHGQGGSF